MRRELLAFTAVLLFALPVSPTGRAAGDGQGGTSGTVKPALPSSLDCGTVRSPTAKGICDDIAEKYGQCVEYNRRLGNAYDCGNDKQLVEWRALAASAEAKEAQARKPAVRLGMTKRQVEKTRWGVPATINTTVVPGGVSEQWVYGDGRYVYFENGRVSAIQARE